MRTRSRWRTKVALTHRVAQKAVPVDSLPNPFPLREGGLATAFALRQKLCMSRMC